MKKESTLRLKIKKKVRKKIDTADMILDGIALTFPVVILVGIYLFKENILFYLKRKSSKI
jgi:hypothetical protein